MFRAEHYIWLILLHGISEESVTTNEGGAVDMFCPDNAARNSIFWKKGPVQFASWDTFNGIRIFNAIPSLQTRGSMEAQTGKFTINNLMVIDAGVYTCELTSPVTGLVTGTLTTTLSVDVPPSDVSVAGISVPPVAGQATPIQCIIGRVLGTEFDIYYKIGDDGTQTAITSTAETDNKDGTKRVVGSSSITFQKSDDSLRFHCIVTKKNLQIDILNDTSVTLVVHYQPSCTISAGSAAQGNTTLFTCSCDGRPTVSSNTWYHNGTSITVSGRYSEPQQGQLQVTNVGFADSGSYTCKGANTIGEGGLSNSVDVSVFYKPIVSVATVTNPVQENTQNVVLSCYSHENPTKTNVMWFFGGTELPVSNGRYSGGILAQPSLTIKQVTRNDGGRYLCRIVNPQGHGDSGYLDLNVTYCPSIASPGIINHRRTVTVQTEEIDLSCQIGTQGNPPVKHYVWKKNGKLYNTTTSNVLCVTPTTVLDSGTYTCELQNDISPCNSATSAGTGVTIHAPPYVESPSSGESYSPLYNMSDFRMMCVISGIPTVAIEWNKGNDLLTSDDFTELSVVQTGTFSYGQTTAQQSNVTWTAGGKYFTCQNITHFNGNYSCIGKSNGAGPDAVRQFSVNVRYPPMVNGVTTVAGQIRGTSTLVCNVCANPTPTNYKWYFRDLYNLVGDQQNLILTNINQTNFDVFICEVSNTVGTVQILYNLKPEGPPEPPENFKISEKTSQSVTLRWNAGYDGGYPQFFVIQYKKEGDDDSLYTALGSIPQDSKSEFSSIVTKLSPATSYVFSIHSINTRSTTPNTSQRKDLIQSTTAKPAAIITSVTHGSNEVTIVWELQEGKPTKYAIQYRVSGEQDFQDLETDIPATQTNITVPFTLTQSSYDFRIVACVQTQLEPQTFPRKKDTVTGNTESQTHVTAGVTTAVLVLVAFSITAVFLIKYRRRSGKGQEHRQDDQNDSTEVAELRNRNIKEPPVDQRVYEKPSFLPGDVSIYTGLRTQTSSYLVNEDTPYADVQVEDNELSSTHIKIIEKISEGAAYLIFKASILISSDWTTAAVKAAKDPGDVSVIKVLMDNLKTMSQLRPHPNVVRSFGSSAGENGSPMIIMEFLPNGNLQQLLRKDRSKNKTVYGNLHGISSSLTSRDLIKFAEDVASGMSYLSSKAILHRDLAARNILVAGDRTCKISHFGFAEDVIESHKYERHAQGRLPIRWMSPEALYDNIFTTQSDVWAYGILLWEIVTLGSSPYPNMSAKQVMEAITEGYRMPQPPHCSQDMHTLMLSCWEVIPSSRPTFKSIAASLKDLLSGDYDVVTIRKFEEKLYEEIDQYRLDEKC